MRLSIVSNGRFGSEAHLLIPAMKKRDYWMPRIMRNMSLDPVPKGLTKERIAKMCCMPTKPIPEVEEAFWDALVELCNQGLLLRKSYNRFAVNVDEDWDG